MTCVIEWIATLAFGCIAMTASVIGWAFQPTAKPQGLVVGWVSNPPFAQRAKIKLLSFYQSTPYGVAVG